MPKVISALSAVAVIVLFLVLGGTLVTVAGLQPEGDAATSSGPGTAFTYQGYLTDGQQAANGSFDLAFALYDDPEVGSQVTGTISSTVAITDGLFTVELDFGDVFDGTPLWLEVGVRPAGQVEPVTPLLPRQRLTAVPYATYSARSPWSGLAGMPADFADGIDDDTLYEAGVGLDLVDTTLDITVSYQLPQGCASDQFARWTGSSWACTESGTGITSWSLSGNGGTTPGTDFLGTIDEAALELHVNDHRALSLEPGVTSPNIIGGYEGNMVGSDLSGATIGGGGRDLVINSVSASFGTVGGGAGNSASGYASTVGGGEGNSVANSYAAVGGGAGNAAGGERSTVSGGSNNTASAQHAAVGGGSGNEAGAPFGTVGGGAGNAAGDLYTTIAGGQENQAGGTAATIGGGSYNSVSAAYGTIAGGGPTQTGNPTTTNNRVYDQYGAIGGGGGNVVGVADGDTASQEFATVGGGFSNEAAAEYATAGGGSGNTASGYASTVGGGEGNAAANNYATVGGGIGNSAGSNYAAIGGGAGNQVTGLYGTVPGGRYNSVAGAFGFAAGYQARAEHTGAFVWSSSFGEFASTDAYQFLIDASGGVGIGTDSPTEMLTVQGGATIQSSDIVSVSVVYGDSKMLQQPRALYAAGDLLYATGYATNTLSIWNVTDPSSHTLIGYTTFQILGPMDVQVVGNRAYIASQNSDMLTILDVSDPADISHVGDTTEYLDYPQGVHVSGKYAYVASMGNDGLTIFDVTDAPAELAATSFITTYLEGTSDVFVVDNYAYVTSQGNNRLVVFDVSDARNPQAVSYAEGSLNKPVRVHVSGIYAYVVSEGADAIVVYDVSNPAQLVYLGEITTGQTHLTHPRSIYVSGNRAYVAYAGDEFTGEHCGLAVLDLSDPAEIAVLNVIDMSNWRNSDLVRPMPVAVTGSGDRIYVANEGHDSVTIFEIDGLQASAVRAGEIQAARLEVADSAAIEGDLGVRGGLNVGSGGALVQGTLSVEGLGDSYIQGRLGIGPVATVITRSVGPGEYEEIVLRQPTHQLDVDGEARFRINDHTNLVLRSPNAGGDEDASLDLIRSDQTTVVTPSARIEFDVADPLTHTTSIRFHTQGPDDPAMISRLRISEEGNLLPEREGFYTLGDENFPWLSVYTLATVNASDGRYKENVAPLPYGLEEVTALRPVAFKWANGQDDGLHYGLIAQEVREVLPEVVSGDDGPNGMLGLNYSELVPVLVNAVQEQQAEIESQAGQIADLEARLEALEGRQPVQASQPGALNFLATVGFGGLLLGAVSLAGVRRMGGRS